MPPRADITRDVWYRQRICKCVLSLCLCVCIPYLLPLQNPLWNHYEVLLQLPHWGISNHYCSLLSILILLMLNVKSIMLTFNINWIISVLLGENIHFKLLSLSVWNRSCDGDMECHRFLEISQWFHCLWWIWKDIFIKWRFSFILLNYAILQVEIQQQN